MKITVEAWCAERMVQSDGRRGLDLTTLALTREGCRERLEIGEQMAEPEWLQRHPYLGVRRVKVETVDE